MSRQGVPDYLVTFRKPGKNPEPVTGQFEEYVGDEPISLNPSRDKESMKRNSIDIWQRYASPVWMDIDPGDTLQKESAREHADEKHVCPLQLQVIRRAVDMWTNPRDVVASWFAGIGSEGHVAIGMGRKFIGCELKTSYFNQAVLNLKSAESFQEMELPFGKAA
jgi:DNA modification methylase